MDRRAAVEHLEGSFQGKEGGEGSNPISLEVLGASILNVDQ